MIRMHSSNSEFPELNISKGWGLHWNNMGQILRVRLREGWNLYRRNATPILKIVLCFSIPINFIRAIIPSAYIVENYGEASVRFLFSCIKLLDSFLGLIVIIGIAYHLEKSLRNEKVTFIETLQFSYSRWFDAIKTSFLEGLILMGLTLLLIIPGLIWSVYYFFSLYIVALRGKSGKEALDYSKNMIQGNW